MGERNIPIEINLARLTVLSSSGPNEKTRDAIALLNEHANEHWAFINGAWHKSYFCKESVIIEPLPGDFFGLGAEPGV